MAGHFGTPESLCPQGFFQFSRGSGCRSRRSEVGRRRGRITRLLPWSLPLSPQPGTRRTDIPSPRSPIRPGCGHLPPLTIDTVGRTVSGDLTGATHSCTGGTVPTTITRLDGSAVTLDDERLTELRGTFRGEVVVPGDA